jgi:hypothetical protein
MGRIWSHKYALYQQHLLRIATLVLFVFLCFTTVISAQQPTATIQSVSGEVLVALQGQAAVSAAAGTALHEGDIIETKAGAGVVLLLSDGSQFQLSQNTRLDLAVFKQKPQTQARVSRMTLWYGKIQATLSPGHQQKGSSFTVDTPNATAGVKFSHPEIEVSYDPETQTTIILAYTVSVTVRNLITKEIKTMPKANQAIVRGEFLWITPLAPNVNDIPQKEQQRQTQTMLLIQTRASMGGVASPAPVSSGGRAETSQSPGPAGPSGLSRPRRVRINTGEE